MWECTKYGDFDTWRNHDDPIWLRLQEEWVDFFDSHSFERTLMREFGHTKIIEPPGKKQAKR